MSMAMNGHWLPHGTPLSHAVSRGDSRPSRDRSSITGNVTQKRQPASSTRPARVRLVRSAIDRYHPTARTIVPTTGSHRAVGRVPPLRPDYDDRVADTVAVLGQEAFAAAWAEGRAMTLEQAVADALDGQPSA